MATPGDTKSLIETAVTRFLADVPALAPLKLVAGVELRGRRDVQIYRVQLPGPVVTKDMASDSQVVDWRSAFEHGEAKVTGVEQFIRLITQVVERQEERSRTRRAKAH